jgi:hypothetical protein
MVLEGISTVFNELNMGTVPVSTKIRKNFVDQLSPCHERRSIFKRLQVDQI